MFKPDKINGYEYAVNIFAPVVFFIPGGVATLLGVKNIAEEVTNGTFAFSDFFDLSEKESQLTLGLAWFLVGVILQSRYSSAKSKLLEEYTDALATGDQADIERKRNRLDWF